MPLSATWNLPLRWLIAPVNAPFTWPKSSLSATDSASAAQFKYSSGLLARADCWWICLAINSLPVPVSPKINTLSSVSATTFTSLSSDNRLSAWPIISVSVSVSNSLEGWVWGMVNVDACFSSLSISNALFNEAAAIALKLRSSLLLNWSNLLGSNASIVNAPMSCSLANNGKPMQACTFKSPSTLGIKPS